MMRPTSKPPCKLDRGELRRVSQDRRFGLVGYHVCCPRCGFVTVALNGSDGLVISESDDGERVSFSRPVRCLYCAVLLGLKNGEADIQEDERVRRVQYR
ncbi:MAG: hypothetical protein A2284_15080 [Deltaproteobacteria bacterium RIFOXYA12_FULL_61_11]|nr:MAG: hypothetical protein A2284_15080 [Deltaproteobacteria bacterium RIFOXYA12_FULL_61_11]